MIDIRGSFRNPPPVLGPIRAAHFDIMMKGPGVDGELFPFVSGYRQRIAAVDHDIIA